MKTEKDEGLPENGFRCRGGEWLLIAFLLVLGSIVKGFAWHSTTEVSSVNGNRKDSIALFHAFYEPSAGDNDHRKKAIINKVYDYSEKIDTSGIYGTTSYNYIKYVMNIDKRNSLLLCVPTMYNVAHGAERAYMGEFYNKTLLKSVSNYDITRIVDYTTIPHRRMVMDTALGYLTPKIYDTTIFGRNILSPFNRQNKLYYRYHVSDINGRKAFIVFKPKLDNTQLVSGTALVDTETGRIIEVDINGDYDMLRYHVNVKMGGEGVKSLFPKSSNLSTRFSLLGNRVRAHMVADYDLPDVLKDTIPAPHDTTLLKKIRPVELNSNELSIYNHYRESQAKRDSTASTKKRNKTKEILWDAIGQNILTRIRSHFGSNDEGSFRLSPIINPLYLGYSKRRGLTYRINLNTDYQFTPQSSIELRVKMGYSFKQKQLYYNIPLTYYLSKKHDAYVRLEVGNGNRITNTTVLDYIKELKGDSVYKVEDKLIYFNDLNIDLTTNYDLSKYFGLKLGIVTHRRTAIDRAIFEKYHQPTSYRSAAPMIELKFRPSGYDGPVITADYERGMKDFLSSNISYERWEFDGQYMMSMSRLQTLSMRLGSGFYTNKDKGWRFLDYTNFRENNVPGGWNDDWSGEFELLDRNWYNMSKYYARANMTYESPILISSWIPLVGRFIEMERIYVSSLVVRHLYPYTEVGYGFTTRIFSVGMFAAFKNEKYNGIGFKFGFELFRRW
jgi:hypothetical protein